jgi:hypothetical protein
MGNHIKRFSTTTEYQITTIITWKICSIINKNICTTINRAIVNRTRLMAEGRTAVVAIVANATLCWEISYGFAGQFQNFKCTFSKFINLYWVILIGMTKK